MLRFSGPFILLDIFWTLVIGLLLFQVLQNLKSFYTPQDQKLCGQIPPEILVYRVGTKEPSDRKRIVRQLQNILFIPRPFSKWWVDAAIKLGIEANDSRNFDLIYATMSPFETAKAACILSHQLGIPWVADLRDAWALDEIQVYPSTIHKKFQLRTMHKLLSTASLIIMNTHAATERLKNTFPDLCNAPIQTITNGFDQNDLRQDIPERTDYKFRIAHVGHFLTTTIKKRGIHELLGGTTFGVDVSTRSPVKLFKAIETVIYQYPELVNDLEIVFVGSPTATERKFVTNSTLSGNCHFTGYIPRNEALKIVRTTDLLFLPMHNLPMGQKSTSIPSKTYEYMASGQPILAAVPDGDAREFLSECGTAFLCRPDDEEEMVRNLIKIYTTWKKKESSVPPVKKNFLSKFERINLTKQLANEFDRCFLQSHQ